MLTILGNGFVGRHVAIEAATKTEVCTLQRPAFDLGDPATYALIPEETTTILHAAGTIDLQGDEAGFRRTNVDSAYLLAAFLNERRSVKRFVYCSTGGVYGPRSDKVSEGAEPAPDTLYASSRYQAEQAIASTFGGETKMLRLYFPYGPGQSHTRLVPRLINSILAGEPIRLKGPNGPKISPIYIDDLAKCVVDACLHQAVNDDVLNIGGAECVSIREVCNIISSLITDKAAEFIEERQGMTIFYCCDKGCGGPGVVSLRNGLERTVRYYVTRR